MNLSVIICAHNPRPEAISRTLSALRTQTLSTDQWELILVDNASSPPLHDHLCLSWHPQARIVVESELGLTPARLRGVRESISDILCFVDDDNVLEADYLINALRIAKDMPWIGCWGGEIHGEFEINPPEWFAPYHSMVAVRSLSRDSWGNAYRYDDAMPCGAGMCVRRLVVEKYFSECANSELRKSLDRKGGSLASNGDVDLAYTAIDMGYGTGRFKSMTLTHLIPAGRLELPYIVKLAESMAESNYMLDSCRVATSSEHRGKISQWSKIMTALRILKMSSAERAITMAKRRGLQKALKRFKHQT
jgi:hypothetical protein